MIRGLRTRLFVALAAVAVVTLITRTVPAPLAMVMSVAAVILSGGILLALIKQHLDALSESAPHLLPLYTVYGIELARLAKTSGRITEEDFNEIISIFKEFLKQKPSTKPKR